jgi:protoporphyrinogen IX oxidase
MIAALKAGHIMALVVWCAGLIVLPILLHVHGRGDDARTQTGFAQLRLLSHFSYTHLITPAAVIAVAFGTVLIVMLELVDPWMLTKLVAVAGMVLVHAWLGHLIAEAGEGRGTYRMPPPLIALVLAVPLMAAVLWLVLAKPDLAPLVERLPEFLLEPRFREIPQDLVPI